MKTKKNEKTNKVDNDTKIVENIVILFLVGFFIMIFLKVVFL